MSAIQSAHDKGGLEAVCDLVVELLNEQEARFQAQISKLENRIAGLERNSRTSSKPSSTDKTNFTNPPKPKSSRIKSGRKPGGQKGHRGATLEKVANPDYVEHHHFTPDSACDGCGHHLHGLASEGDWEVRQVFDIPPISLEVTEHRAQRCTCPGCGKKITANFPAEASAPTQYGPRLQAYAVYLRAYQLVPYERLSHLLDDLFGVSISEGTLDNIFKRGSQKAEVAMEPIKQALIESPVGHADETGCTVNGERQWLHVFSSERLTAYHIDPKRGREGMERMGILPNFQNLLIHDCFGAYFTFTDCLHGLCNPHLVRELTYLHEQLDQTWAAEMVSLLMEAKDLSEREMNRAEGSRRVIGKGTLKKILNRYHGLLELGYQVNPEPPPKAKGAKGRPARGKALNLLDRLKTYWEEVLGFFLYPGVYPFSNNQAEQDVRMMKVREKISGTFRSAAHAKGFCDLRSIISSARKQGRAMLDSLGEMMTNPLALAKSLIQGT